MDRLGAISSFLLITALMLLGLRGVHVLIGIAYPASLPGPFELSSLAEVERHTGFSPHVPFYRPMTLGAAPLEIVAVRRPVPTVRIRWTEAASVELTEWGGGHRPTTPNEAQPMPGREDVVYWERGDELFAVLPVSDRWLQIRTDLGLGELGRIIETLLPYDRLL
jgi:hypothetical protein